ncbi:hypothetical protein IFR05_011268 [Cadophora sp. M221]|nr:hypothetical protein IFR05_011268 [Cadophora sp. M221]
MEQGQAAPETVVEKKTDGGEGSSNRVRKQVKWCGRFESGNWYCQCDMKAKQPWITDESNPNLGKKFYCCPRKIDDKDKCQFFLFFHDEVEAKEWVKANPTTPIKQAPKPREIQTPDTPSSRFMTGWVTSTKASGKKRAIKDISDEEDKEDGMPDKGKGKGKGPDEDFVIVENDDDGDVFDRDNSRNGSPSRKSAKVTRFATPGQPCNKPLDNCRDALPTPATSGRDVEDTHEARQLQARDASPTQIQLDAAIVLGGAELDQSQGRNDLLTSILGLIKADYPGLKSSTEIMIQHEIEQEARIAQAEVKGFKKTISRLRNKVDELENRVDELETTVNLLIGGDIEDVVVLSD